MYREVIAMVDLESSHQLEACGICKEIIPPRLALGVVADTSILTDFITPNVGMRSKVDPFLGFESSLE